MDVLTTNNFIVLSGVLCWSYKMNIKGLLKIFVKQHTRTTLSRSSLHRRISDTGGGEEGTGREGADVTSWVPTRRRHAPQTARLAQP